MLKQDAHLHTPFCPHGTPDSFYSYIEKAIKKGFDSITFTEHAPLPPSFHDPTPAQDSAMKLQELESYITKLDQLKQEYKGQLIVKLGLRLTISKSMKRKQVSF